MELLFSAAGIASLAYVTIILIYNGITSFLWFWPLFALLNFLMAALVRYLRKQKKKNLDINPAPFVFAFTSYGIGVTVLLLLLGLIFLNAHTVEQKNLDYVIVMGTDLDNNKISTSLKRRLDKALEYAHQNPDTVFVLSGGRGDYDQSTESTVMYYYMIQHGVPEKKLLLEFYSDSTQEKIGYSIATIMEDREEKMNAPVPEMFIPEDRVVHGLDRPMSVGIITSEFNLYRATSMAKKRGIEDICPIATDTDELMLVHLAVREAVAIFKDRLVGNL